MTQLSLLSVILISERERRELRLGAELCEGLMRGFAHGLEPSHRGGIPGLIPLYQAFNQVSKKFQMNPEAQGFF